MSNSQDFPQDESFDNLSPAENAEPLFPETPESQEAADGSDSFEVFLNFDEMRAEARESAKEQIAQDAALAAAQNAALAEVQEAMAREPVSEESPEDLIPQVPAQEDAAREAEEAQAFEELFAPEEAEASVQEPQPARKGRPKRRKGEGLLGIPNIFTTIVWLALVVVIGVTAGRMLWICAAEVLAFGREDKTVTVTIYETDDMDTIVEKLYAADLIHYKGLFRLYAQFAVDDGDIQPGMWDLNKVYDYHALVRGMNPGSTHSTVKVLIPEGYTCAQIFALLQEKKVCTVQDLETYVTSGELPEYWFTEDMPQERAVNCLEGFLFPDTYEFYQNDTPANVLGRMMANFDSKFDEAMRAQLSNLNDRMAAFMRANGKNDAYIKEHKMTLQGVVTLASMIEREMATEAEGFTISSVIYNRLYNWGNNPAYLNIDACIVYALGGKNELTLEDLQIDSPYNTYTNIGLTPGPISNPGLSCLQAALYPANTNYYYYVLDPELHEHHFSRTLEEHNAFRATIGG